MFAARNGDFESIQILVAYGANLHLRNSRGQTIVDTCEKELFNDPIFQEWVSFYLLSIYNYCHNYVYILSVKIHSSRTALSK